MNYRRIVFELFLGVFLLMSTSTLLWSGEPGDLIRKIILKDISLEEGVSLVHNYRSQIYSFLAKSSYEELYWSRKEIREFSRQQLLNMS